MLLALSQSSRLWAFQVREALLSLKTNTSVERVASHLMESVMDRLLMHTVFDNLAPETINSMCLKCVNMV